MSQASPLALGQTMNTQRLHLLLSAIRFWWPAADIQDVSRDRAILPPLTLPCDLLVYKDAFVKSLLEQKAHAEQVDPLYFAMKVEQRSVTFTVGPEDSEGDRIVQDLRYLIACLV